MVILPGSQQDKGETACRWQSPFSFLLAKRLPFPLQWSEKAVTASIDQGREEMSISSLMKWGGWTLSPTSSGPGCMKNPPPPSPRNLSYLLNLLLKIKFIIFFLNSAHSLNFENYGNMKSIVWIQNRHHLHTVYATFPHYAMKICSSLQVVSMSKISSIICTIF